MEGSLSNPDVELKTPQKQWIADTCELYMYVFLTLSASFYRDLQLFFGTQDLSEIQTFIGTKSNAC